MDHTYARTAALARGYQDVKERAFAGIRTPRRVNLLTQPRSKPECFRLIVEEGRVVAGTEVVDIPLRYGEAVLSVGGFAGVVADPDIQKRGYGRAIMERTLAFLKEEGFELSLLFGIPDYYHRFGFRTAIAWTACHFQAGSFVAPSRGGIRVRKMRRTDIPDTASLYERTLGRYPLSVARTTEDWAWYFYKGRKSAEGYTLRDPMGRLVGYFFGDTNPKHGHYRVNEAPTVGTTEAFDALIAAVSRRARDAFFSAVEIGVPASDPFARYCLTRKRVTITRRADFQSGPMMRIVNHDPLFEKIRPVLAGRWRRAPRSAPSAPVTVATCLGRVAFVPQTDELAVRVNETRGEIVEMPAEALTELVTGFRDAGDVLADANVSASREARAVLSAVFPVLDTFFSRTDAF